MREADKIKAVRSYTTVWNQARNRWELKGEAWLPGYTIANKETPAEAWEFRKDMLELELKRIANQIVAAVDEIAKETN